MMQVIALINSFLCGAVCMVMFMCIQPEIVPFIQKVYSYDFNAKRKKDEEEEGALFKTLYKLVDNRLTDIYELTRNEQPDSDEIITAWDEMDHAMDLLKAAIHS